MIASQTHDDGVLAARPVVGVEVLALGEHLVQHQVAAYIAGAHAEKNRRGPIERDCLDLVEPATLHTKTDQGLSLGEEDSLGRLGGVAVVQHNLIR